jgi:uncharacterized protein
MTEETDLDRLLKGMRPIHNAGNYVFCTVDILTPQLLSEAVFIFKEHEGITVIVKKEFADNFGLGYSFIASWITLTVHSSLESVGFTAAFSGALTRHGISCNVVAAFHHDHIFVHREDTQKALDILYELST